MEYCLIYLPVFAANVVVATGLAGATAVLAVVGFAGVAVVAAGLTVGAAWGLTTLADVVAMAAGLRGAVVEAAGLAAAEAVVVVLAEVVVPDCVVVFAMLLLVVAGAILTIMAVFVDVVVVVVPAGFAAELAVTVPGNM